MARVGLTKITSIKSIEDKIININGEDIAIKQYLPINKKSDLLNEVVSEVLSANGTNSPIREYLYTNIYLIQYYTNINLTQTMIAEAGKTYDLLKLNGILDQVIDNIPEEEYNLIVDMIHDTLQALSDYRLSATGLLDYASSSQNAELKDLDTITDQLRAVADNPILSGVLEKLG